MMKKIFLIKLNLLLFVITSIFIVASCSQHDKGKHSKTEKVSPANDKSFKVDEPKNNNSTLYHGNPCKRANVGFLAIAAELNKIYRCTPEYMNCIFNQKETLTHGYSNGWLWSGSSSNNFTITQQNTLIALAKQWATNNRSLCSNGSKKSIISITFFTDIATGSGGYFVGCNIQYGCCTGAPH